ncbi:MAG: GreA/GreB family elongation factor [Polyangiaceae bacterium]|jgi:transcription elongation GreA/GreB family factor
MPPSAKPALKAELLALLAADLETLERAHRATTEGATHEEAKPENDKDTRALEQSYLARGQATRIEELRASVAGVMAMVPRDFDGRPAALGALVTVDEDGEESTLLLAPGGGGARLAGGTVQVVTPASPLGRAILGKRAGDDAEVAVAGKTRTMQVVRVV